MHTYTIHITFDAPVENVFSLINNHESFGKIQGVKMKRIVDGVDPGNPNGEGSVRRFTIGLPLEEKIVKSEKNKTIEYTIVKGMYFFSSHYGTIHFRSTNPNQTIMDYSITIGIKIPILSKLIINIIGASLKRAFKQLNKKLKENPNYTPV